MMKYPLGLGAWILRRLDPEFAHQVAIAGLKMLQRLPDLGLSADKVMAHGHSFPLGLSNRLGLAAGFDKNAEVFVALAGFGFSFIEVGTVTPKAQSGNPRPRIWRKGDETLINHLGFNNCGAEKFRENIIHQRHRLRVVKLFANVGQGRDTAPERALEDYRLLFERLKDSVDAFVVNISSPNTPGLRNLQTLNFLDSLSDTIPDNRPTLVKLSPDLSNDELAALCRKINESKTFRGVVLTNTSGCLAEQLYGHKQGGLSGEPLFDRAIECVELARKTLSSQKLIIGVGGITSGERAYKMRKAGADLLEIYTGFVSRGPKIIIEILKAIRPLEN